MGMTKPMFRIEQLISALLKGAPEDPVYLRVGSSTYGIKSITDGSIRVTSDGSTQDAAQVVKTLRRYVTNTPKGDKTGISWRIVGVGGGTAIKSVSHDGSKIVVTTLANEGKAAEVFESPYAGKGSLFKFGGGSDDALGGFTAKELTESSAIHGDFDHASLNYSGHQNIAARAEESSPDYDASAYDPLSESATPSDYDPVTFEAPRSKRKSRKKKKEPTYKQQHSAAVSKKIREIMNEFDRTGKVGRSTPKSRSAALTQAVAIAYSMVNRSYRQSGKRLPSGVKRSEGEQSHPFDAPMGYGPMGPQPFYGNRRRLVRDRWGNLRFIRRRKDGTYMDNVDFGRSLKVDRRMQAKTWAPLGFRDQGDGSLDLLTSLMGAEDDDFSDNYEFVVEIYDNEGEECIGFVGGYYHGKGSTIQQAADDAREAIIDDMEREQRRIVKAQSRNTAPRATARRSVAGARFVSVSQWNPDELDYVEIGADLPADIKFNTAMAAEDDVFEASRRSGSDAGEGICGGCGKNSEHRMNFGRRKMCYDCAMERYGAEDVYVHGDDGEARSIRVNKTHARNMSNLSEGATTTVKDQRKGTLHTVKRVGKGFDLAAEPYGAGDSAVGWVVKVSSDHGGFDMMRFDKSQGRAAMDQFKSWVTDLKGDPTDLEINRGDFRVWLNEVNGDTVQIYLGEPFDTRLGQPFGALYYEHYFVMDNLSFPENPTDNQLELLDAFADYGDYYNDKYHDKIVMRGLEIADEPDFQKVLAVCQEHDGIINPDHPAEAYIIAICCYDAIQ